MVEDDGKDQRYYPRYHNVKEDFPGKILSADTGDPVGGRVMDVSRDGLGFLAEERIVPGARLKLRLADRELIFRVVYCTADIIYKDQYRCGLNLAGARENLVALFGAHDCLEEVKL